MGFQLFRPASRRLQYTRPGRRIDDLQTSEGWKALKEVAQKEGIPGIFYERTFGEHSRVYGFVKILLMIGDSHEVRLTVHLP